MDNVTAYRQDRRQVFEFGCRQDCIRFAEAFATACEKGFAFVCARVRVGQVWGASSEPFFFLQSEINCLEADQERSLTMCQDSCLRRSARDLNVDIQSLYAAFLAVFLTDHK